MDVKQDTPLIETRHLKKYFQVGRNSLLHAVDDVDIRIDRGDTLGIVGESGCGKSTLGRTIIRLLNPTSGEILLNGNDIANYSEHQMRSVRRDMQIIFQDPYSSINPRMTVAEIIAQPMLVYKEFNNKADLYKRVAGLMNTVGLAARLYDAYPHELDGGRRQRIGIARALALNPKFIVCDEPVSALDVSIQAQILNLLMDLQEEYKIAYMFITHDMSVVKHISDEIAVMYLGQCIEKCHAKELFRNPLHPYTKMLLTAIPKPNLSSRLKMDSVIKGEVTNPIDPSPGCRFAPRCEFASEECRTVNPAFCEIEPNHYCACHKVIRELKGGLQE